MFVSAHIEVDLDLLCVHVCHVSNVEQNDRDIIVLQEYYHGQKKLHQTIFLLCQTSLTFDKFWHTCIFVNFL